MEGAVTGVVVPSGTILEAETWVKFSKIPVEFLTPAALSRIASLIGYPVQVDEDTFEKMEDVKWPPPLRRNKSKRTSANILVRICVTAPLPPRVAVICPKGRKYVILIHSDPTPKVCLKCFCTGHFDFECCGTKEAIVEILVDDDVAVEDVLGVDVQPAACCDCMCDDVDGEQGAVTIDGVVSFEVSPVGEAVITDGVDFFEDATVVEAMKFPAATCDVGDAIVGELEAVHSIVGGFFEQPLEERTAAGLEVQPLLPAPIAADGSEGTFINDGFVCCVDPPLVEVVLETFSDSFDDDPLAGKELAAGPLATVGESSATDLQAIFLADRCIVDEQFSGDFHIWCDPSDDQGLLEADSGAEVGILGVEIRDVDSLSGIVTFCDGVHGAAIFDRAECHDFSPVIEAELAEDLHHFEQVLSVVNCPKKHQKWRDKSDVQGLFSSHLQDMADPYMIDVQAPPGVNKANKQHLWCDLFDEHGLFSDEQLLSVVNCPRKHHKWRDKSVVLGLWCDNLAEQGMFPFVNLDLLLMLPRLGAVIIDWAMCYGDPPDFEAALVEDFHNFEQGFFVVKCFSTHHKWRDKSEMQGLFCKSFDDLILLQTFLDATILDQLIFKIQHKWRDKGMLIFVLFLMLKKKKKKKRKIRNRGRLGLLQHAVGSFGLLRGCF